MQSTSVIWIACACSLTLVASTSAQTTAEHEQHHPPDSATTARSPTSPSATAMSMGGMMLPPPRDAYPTLMILARLAPAERAQLQRDSEERMLTGTALMAAGMERVTAAARRGEYAMMSDALEEVREGLARLEAGIAGRTALDSAVDAPALALSWFRSEMSLAATGPRNRASLGDGFSRFHLTIMVILGGFAATMIWIHFQKMRRIEALVTDHRQPSGGAAVAVSPTAETR